MTAVSALSKKWFEDVAQRGESTSVGDVRYSILTEVQFQAINGSGWILADGRSVAGSKYEDITGNSAIPDARGLFVRGKNNGRADGNQDPDGDRTLGNLQLDKTRIPRNTGFTSSSNGDHRHATAINTNGNTGTGTAWGSTLDIPAQYPVMIGAGFATTYASYTRTDGSHAHSINGGGDNESTPKNLAINIFIRIN